MAHTARQSSLRTPPATERLAGRHFVGGGAGTRNRSGHGRDRAKGNAARRRDFHGRARSKSLNDIAGTASVITAEDLERRNATNIKNAVRYEPGVTVGNNPNRGGATNFNIRGIGGNRVLVLVDGFPAPDFPAPISAARRATRAISSTSTA